MALEVLFPDVQTLGLDEISKSTFTNTILERYDKSPAPSTLPSVQLDVRKWQEQAHSLPQWRPRYHITAPRGWMNDPCAPGYDVRTGQYHVNFQWNPSSCSWEPPSWGTACSSDFMNWRVSSREAMNPTSTQDFSGVFTGCMLPSRSCQGVTKPNRKQVAFYTSAQSLPIHYTLPYRRGSEKLALATSSDSGMTWQRCPDNITLEEPPPGLDITGWRDPYIGEWHALDEVLGTRRGQLYGVVSGGLRGETPTVFLYHIDTVDPTKWTYLSSLTSVGLNYNPSRWTGDFGINWEVCNFLSLQDEADKTHSFLIISAEGITKSDSRSGEISKDHRQIIDTAEYLTMLLLRSNGFWDPATGHFVTIGWLFEEDLPQTAVQKQGWSGCLSTPRILQLRTWERVARSLKTPLGELSCFDSTADASGTYTMRTLTAMPDPRLQDMRGPPFTLLDGSIIDFPENGCASWELDLDFCMSNRSQRMGFDIFHSPDHSQLTRVYFEPLSEILTVDRSRSTTIRGVGTGKKTAPHTLFEIEGNDNSAMLEDLTFHAFYDASVLEIFVNERTALSTRVYPDSGTVYGIKAFCEVDVDYATRDEALQQTTERHSSVERMQAWPLNGVVTSL
ncbi:Sucrose-6-phosphate hydrolase [Cyphellophora attinorum]|uniref:Sucrose-6-phosphate hydrolase n=1 Tax=Cyphellophora attinorum TaxID=1664694 RepID=A0A0N1H8D3_9EURO|nr:Sucrose-6-phosphate hydrolase [Phialophora attinorum]KPI39566.1 Sucrose-6-phosphate hydrolase [Phialophora attinorum]